MRCICATLFSTQVQKALHCSLQRCVGFESCYDCTPFLQGMDLYEKGITVLQSS